MEAVEEVAWNGVAMGLAMVAETMAAVMEEAVTAAAIELRRLRGFVDRASILIAQ